MATYPHMTHEMPFSTHEQPAMVGRPLAQKLARVLAEVHRVPKNGRNDFHNYDYVTESDLVDHIRDKLAEQGVAIFPSVRDSKVVELEDHRKRQTFLTTVTLDVTLIDGESGDLMTTTWIGQGLDPADKGYYKAYTGALKYFLLKTFLISTGDDPEREEAVQAPAPQRPQSPRLVRPEPAREPRASREPREPEAQRAQAAEGAEVVSEATQAADEVASDEADTRWLQRVAELNTLLDEAVEAPARDAFLALYIKRMKATTLEESDAQKLGSMCRKLRGQSPAERADFIDGVLAEQA